MTRIRPSADGSLPPRRGLMPATYRGKCECGRKIEPGDFISADQITRQVLCAPCFGRDARLKASLLSEVRRAKASQVLIDRIRQIEALSSTNGENRREIEYLKDQLLREFIEDKEVQRFLFQKASCAKCRPPLIPIPTKYENKCCTCGRLQLEGRIVLWSRLSKTIHCAQCMLRN